MTDDPFATLARAQRTMHKNFLERCAVHDGAKAMAEGGPDAALVALAEYATPYGRILEQERLEQEALA